MEKSARRRNLLHRECDEAKNMGKEFFEYDLRALELSIILSLPISTN